MKTKIYTITTSISYVDDGEYCHSWSFGTYEEACAKMDSFIHASLYKVWLEDNPGSAVVIHDTDYLKECVAEKHNDEEELYEPDGIYLEYWDGYINFKDDFWHCEMSIGSEILDVNEYVEKSDETPIYKEVSLW